METTQWEQAYLPYVVIFHRIFFLFFSPIFSILLIWFVLSFSFFLLFLSPVSTTKFSPSGWTEVESQTFPVHFTEGRGGGVINNLTFIHLNLVTLIEKIQPGCGFDCSLTRGWIVPAVGAHRWQKFSRARAPQPRGFKWILLRGQF